ncbi:MAG: hypothetical protein GXO24_04410 [Chlorobi bacterium]|nr:hypothetical protein [Chlorobiota bacterium]
MKKKVSLILLFSVMAVTVLSPTVPFLVSEWHQWKASQDMAAYLQEASSFDDPYLQALIKRAAPVKHSKSKSVLVAPHFVFIPPFDSDRDVAKPEWVVPRTQEPGSQPDLYAFLFVHRIFRPPAA